MPLPTRGPARCAGHLFVVLAFAVLAYAIAPHSPVRETVYVVTGDMDATQQSLLIGDGMDKVMGKVWSYYNTSILYPDHTQLRSTEPFLGYVALGLPLRLAGLDNVTVFEVERWAIVFGALVYAWLLFRALGLKAALAVAGAVLCVSQPGLVSGIERLQVVAVPLVLAGVYHGLMAARAAGWVARAHGVGLFVAAALYPLLGAYNTTILLLAGLLVLPFLVRVARELAGRRALASVLVPIGMAGVADALLLAPWLVDRSDLRAYTNDAFLQIKHWGTVALPLRPAHILMFIDGRIGASLTAAIAALAGVAAVRAFKRARGCAACPDALPEVSWRHLAVLPVAALPMLGAAVFGVTRETVPALGLAFDAACCAALLLHFRSQARMQFTPERLASNGALLAAGLALFLSLMSFGPAYASNGHPLETGLARLLLSALPALKSIREWERIWLFAMLALSACLTLALHVRMRSARPAARSLVAAVIVSGALWTLHERTLVATPRIEADRDVVALGSRSSAKGALYVHPAAPWNSRTAVMMVANAARLRRPVVNGSLGICLPWYTYATFVLRRFPDPEALWLLRKWKVQTVVGLGGGLGETPAATVKVFENGQGQFACDILPLGEQNAHPSDARPTSRDLARVEGRCRLAPREAAVVEVPAGFAAEALELHFPMSVATLVTEAVDVFTRSVNAGARLNDGQSGEWLQSLAADSLLRRQAPVAVVYLAAPATQALELRFRPGRSDLDRVVLLGRWNPRH